MTLVTVLLVEDDPLHRMFAAALLKARGFLVLHAADGEEALRVFEAVELDLVLLDLQMPNMDGFDAARGMRRVEAQRLGRVPIIAVTSHSTDESRRRCLEAGIDEHLSKPVSAAELDAVVSAFVRRDPLDFHLGTALDWASGDESGLVSVARAFLAESSVRITEVQRALDSGDVASLGRTAHEIEGAAHRLAMPRLRDIAHRIAVLSAQGDFEKAAALTEELEAAFGRGAAALRREIDSA